MTDTNPLAPIEALHRPIRVYDECEHDEDHGCEPVYVYDYIGCSESVIGWACATCCYDDVYPREDCPHGATHNGIERANSCPTHTALEEARQAVDALVAERDSIAFIHEGCAGLRRRDNEHLIKRAEQAEAERDAHRLAATILAEEVEKSDNWRRRYRDLKTESRVLPCDGGCVDAPEEDCSRHGREPSDLWRIIDEIRTERDAAREALARVEAIHGSTHWCFGGEPREDGTYCSDDVYEPGTKWWPCPTLAALTQPATDEETE